MAKRYHQGANDRLDESLGMRRGKESTKKQSYKSRRDESRGAKNAHGTRSRSEYSIPMTKDWAKSKADFSQKDDYDGNMDYMSVMNKMDVEDSDQLERQAFKDSRYCGY